MSLGRHDLRELALAMLLTFGCEKSPERAGVRTPEPTRHEVALRVDPQRIDSITVLPLDMDALATPRRIARCGPGLYWSPSERGIGDLSTQREYEVPIGNGAPTSLDCPAAGGIVMSFADGSVVFASDLSFARVVRLSSELRAPIVAVGPRNEIWLWQHGGKELHRIDGEGHRRLALRYEIAAVASAAARSAIVALRDGEGSRIVLVGGASDGSLRIDDITRVEGEVTSLAVGAGGKLYVSGPSCLGEVSADGVHRCIAAAPAGSLSAFGHELTLLPREGDRMFVFETTRAATP